VNYTRVIWYGRQLYKKTEIVMYYRIHTIKKNRYLYQHESYRVPGHKNPKKRTTYIGPLRALAIAGGIAALGTKVRTGDKLVGPVETRVFVQDLEVSKNWNPDIEAARELGTEKSAPKSAEETSQPSRSEK
jgi:hypothetical protein